MFERISGIMFSAEMVQNPDVVRLIQFLNHNNLWCGIGKNTKLWSHIIQMFSYGSRSLRYCITLTHNLLVTSAKTQLNFKHTRNTMESLPNRCILIYRYKVHKEIERIIDTNVKLIPLSIVTYLLSLTMTIWFVSQLIEYKLLLHKKVEWLVVITYARMYRLSMTSRQFNSLFFCNKIIYTLESPQNMPKQCC